MTKEKTIGTKKERAKRINGSEFATVLDINPYQKQIELILDKAGVIVNTFEGNDATRRGELLESEVIALFEEKTGIKVSNEQKEYTLEPENCLPLVCHVDGITSNDTVFEAKTTDVKSKTWQNGIPEYYKAQLEFNCMLAGKSKADIVVAFCNGNEIQSIEHYEYETCLSKEEIIQHCINFTEKVNQYRSVGVVNNGKTEKAEIDSKLIEELEDLNNKISEMKAEIKPFEDQKKTIETKLKNLIGCNNAIENDLYRISLGNRLTSPSLDYKITRSGIKIEYINENS